MKSQIENDLEILNKKLYLDSPGLWIDFNDKINDNKFDEFVLFIATKYDFKSILEFAYENKLIDFNSKSKNKDFDKIINHLLNTASLNNSINCLNYLNNFNKKEFKNDELNYNILENKVLNNINNINKNINNTQANKDNIQNYENIDNNVSKEIPIFKCTNCNENLFEKGYLVKELNKFAFQNNTLEKIESQITENIICGNCNFEINVTSKEMNELSTINLCDYCNNDLRNVKIIKSNSMNFDYNKNSFELDEDLFLCGECKNEINKTQKEFFIKKAR